MKNLIEGRIGIFRDDIDCNESGNDDGDGDTVDTGADD